MNKHPSKSRDLFRQHETAAFFILTLAFSWGWWIFAYVVLASDNLSRVLAIPGAFGPLVAAALVTWAVSDDLQAWAAQIIDWRVAPRWYLVAVGLPILITVGGVGTGLVLAGASLDLSILGQRLLIFPVVLLVTLIVGGGQEEPGWRGFALPRLQASYSALTASLIIGSVWAVWHLPLFIMDTPRNQSGNFLLYALLVIGLSIVMTWCYNGTGGSVLLVMILHAGVNTSGSLLPIQMSVVDQWPLVIDGAIIIAVWLVAIGVIVWNNIETLSRRGVPDLAVAGVKSEK